MRAILRVPFFANGWDPREAQHSWALLTLWRVPSYSQCSQARRQAVRKKRYAQVYTSGNVAAGVGAEVSHTVRSYVFAGADGRQWHAARHRHRVCYCGAHGDHPRLRPADEARLQ